MKITFTFGRITKDGVQVMHRHGYETLPRRNCTVCGDTGYVTATGDRRAISYPCDSCRPPETHAQNSEGQS